MPDFKNIFPNKDQFDTMNAMLAIIANKDGNMDITSWKAISQMVKMGLAPKLFPVGYEFSTLDSDTEKNIIWVVRGHNHHTAANEKLVHTMTLETKFVYSQANGSQKALQFDGTEALYYAADGLAAGTYNFTVANQRKPL